jgi:hypothetical protein
MNHVCEHFSSDSNNPALQHCRSTNSWAGHSLSELGLVGFEIGLLFNSFLSVLADIISTIFSIFTMVDDYGKVIKELFGARNNEMRQAEE